MLLKIDVFKLLFIVASIGSLFFIDRGYSLVELSLKLVSIVALCFYYLRKTIKINYWYVLVILFSCISSSLLIFHTSFLALGTFFLLGNRWLYIIMGRRAFIIKNYRILAMFLFVFLIPVVIIFPQLQSDLNELRYPILMIGISSAIMCTFSFVNYFHKMTIKNMFFVLGLLLFVLADILIVYNQFIAYNIFIVIVYTSMYYIARYLVCEAIIIEKR